MTVTKNDEIDLQFRELCAHLPFEIKKCENISQQHHGHASANSHSHFKLTFTGFFQSMTDKIRAHKQVMSAVSPLILSHTIHSVVIEFESD